MLTLTSMMCFRVRFQTKEWVGAWVSPVDSCPPQFSPLQSCKVVQDDRAQKLWCFGPMTAFFALFLACLPASATGLVRSPSQVLGGKACSFLTWAL